MRKGERRGEEKGRGRGREGKVALWLGGWTPLAIGFSASAVRTRRIRPPSRRR